MQENIGIGDKTKDNGILILISTGDREIRIEVGTGLEGAIPDGKAGRILDNYAIPDLKNNNWDHGIKNCFNAIVEEVCKEYNITLDGSIPAVSKYYNDSDVIGFEAFCSMFLFMFLFGNSTRLPKVSRKKALLFFAIRFCRSYICFNEAKCYSFTCFSHCYYYTFNYLYSFIFKSI